MKSSIGVLPPPTSFLEKSPLAGEPKGFFAMAHELRQIDQNPTETKRIPHCQHVLERPESFVRGIRFACAALLESVDSVDESHSVGNGYSTALGRGRRFETLGSHVPHRCTAIGGPHTDRVDVNLSFTESQAWGNRLLVVVLRAVSSSSGNRRISSAAEIRPSSAGSILCNPPP